MSSNYYDIIIIGSGISGLYSAYNIKKMSPNTSFLILEKYKKQWIGGRTSNDIFYGTEIVTGAGIGRKKKDKLLYKLLNELHIPTNEYQANPQVSTLIEEVDIKNIMNELRDCYDLTRNKNVTFKQFATNILGSKTYKNFVLSSGYSDYENEDAYETLYHYGMEDNYCCWKAFSVPWKELVMTLYDRIGEKHFRFSSNVTNIEKIEYMDKNRKRMLFSVENENRKKYICNKVIIATTIDTVRKLLPKHKIYNDIHGQPFMRIYGKFSNKSIPILKSYIKDFTKLPGPLQKVIPIEPDKGIYMICYNDNKNTEALKNYRKNTKQNREILSELLEKSLGIPEYSLELLAIKDYYWPIGTHFYKPLDEKLYKNREEFVYLAQHPESCLLVVGEDVSRNQGWVEGALESVKEVLTKKWIVDDCI